MKVTQFTNSRGNPQADHFVINDGKGKLFFQSYKSIIAMVEGINVTLDAETWDYSTTTAKHRNHFLNMTTKEIKAQIETGEIILADLNS